MRAVLVPCLRPRAAATALLAAACLFVGGLSALAEGGGPAVPAGPTARSAPALALAPGATGSPAGALGDISPDAIATAHAGQGLPASPKAAATPAADPPPFAPGGDDILGTEPARAGGSGPGLADRATPLSMPGAAAALSASTVRARVPALPFVLRQPAAPALQLWLDRSQAAEGSRPRLNIAASGVGSCQASGAWQGALPAYGRVPVPELPPGRHRLGVACTGNSTEGSDRIERSLTIAVPLPVLPGSRANRLAYPTAVGAGLGPAVAGDFFQEGRAAVFVALPAEAGIQWLAPDDAGRWTDRSAELLPQPADRRSCAAPSQALSADLNRDGLPDILLACAEGPLLLFLSQPGGRYLRIDTALPAPAGLLELRDADGDGLLDIASADAPGRLLWQGLGDGRFSAGVRAEISAGTR